MLGETYLNSSMMKLLKMSGYNFAYRNGGVAILIKNHPKFKEWDDLLVFQVSKF